MNLYYPSKLSVIKNKIVREHENAVAIPIIKKEDDLKQLIMQIVKLDSKSVKAYSLSMNDVDVLRVSTYLPHNYYGVPLHNLFLVFKYRSNPISCNALYKEWQNSYNSKNCNDFILDLLQTDNNMIEVTSKYNYQGEEYQTVLKKANKPVAFGKFCLEHTFPARFTLEKKASFFGVEADSKLFHDMESLFYTYCNKKDYLDAKNQLEEIVRKYSDVYLRMFLINFLSVMSIVELDGFERLGRYLNGKLGSVDTKSCAGFFDGMRKDLWIKYRTWMIRLFVNEIFGLDERSVFWRDYSFVSKPTHYKRTDCVVMEFEDFYSIEFLGKGMGPWYLIGKDLYTNRIQRHVLTENNSSELKSYLFGLVKSNKYKEPELLRRPHLPNPGWESKFRYEIRKWKVTVMLDLG